MACCFWKIIKTGVVCLISFRRTLCYSVLLNPWYTFHRWCWAWRRRFILEWLHQQPCRGKGPGRRNITIQPELNWTKLNIKHNRDSTTNYLSFRLHDQTTVMVAVCAMQVQRHWRILFWCRPMDEHDHLLLFGLIESIKNPLLTDGQLAQRIKVCVCLYVLERTIKLFS